ncbi:MAG: hypothetical protein C4534_08415 [Gaiellales bacterium]|nr:MAG: hypothetical protein C4534_08415 [Gaiellales bacterium]
MPLAAVVAGASLSGMLLRRYLDSRKPDLLAWSASLLLLATAAACALAGSLDAWPELTAKTYYLCAAVLFTALASLGTVYYNTPRIIGHVWLAVLTLASAITAVLLAGAAYDEGKLEEATGPGWLAVEAGETLTGIVVAISSIGTVILVAAAVYGLVYRRAGLAQTLLALGVLLVAVAGGLARLDAWELASMAQLPGMLSIYTGAIRADRFPGGRFPGRQ